MNRSGIPESRAQVPAAACYFIALRGSYGTPLAANQTLRGEIPRQGSTERKPDKRAGAAWKAVEALAGLGSMPSAFRHFPSLRLELPA